ncbi:hypothetical protein SPHINGOT1_80218 [Sphingomonas sp. T1]|nr:hypothetical protein SPHINGOT1_80218 [Sphingomonas sp. T1]
MKACYISFNERCSKWNDSYGDRQARSVLQG